MRLFINNKRIKLYSKGSVPAHLPFDKVVKGLQEDLDLRLLKGNVLISLPTTALFKYLLDALDSKKLPDLLDLGFEVQNVDQAEQIIKSHFKIIKAAGGIVMKEDKILLIHRMGLWDLPKGKQEKGENSRVCAVREIEEECGVKSICIDKICSTWHSYSNKGNQILKKTKWYLLQCIDDSQLGPQEEEGIEKVEWKSLLEAEELLSNSYLSIREVLETYKLEIKHIAAQ